MFEHSLDHLIQQLHLIEQELSSLEEKKLLLRSQLKSLLQTIPTQEYVYAQQGVYYHLKIRPRHHYEYQRTLLEERLSKPIIQFLLEPDSKLFKPYRDQVRQLLLPILDKVGKISRDRIELALRLELLTSEQLNGAETKKTQGILYVRNGSNNMTSAITT